jgi:osmoprotectant transport system ATP-binding protein
MGDRIAILREGGVLAQYDTPDAILAHPASEFVAAFVGEDRALRRLALRTLRDVPLGRLESDSQNQIPAVSLDTTVRNAVSLMLETKSDRLVAEDEDGNVAGIFRLSDTGALL